MPDTSTPYIVSEAAHQVTNKIRQWVNKNIYTILGKYSPEKHGKTFFMGLNKLTASTEQEWAQNKYRATY